MNDKFLLRKMLCEARELRAIFGNFAELLLEMIKINTYFGFR